MRAILLCIYIAMYLGSYAQGQKNFIDKNYIEVVGTAEISVTPDEIYLNIYLNEKDFNGKKKLEDIEKELISSLTALGINVKEDLSISNAYKQIRESILGTREMTSRTYVLLVRKPELLKAIFRDLSSKGIRSISINKVDHSEIEMLKAETKKNAIIAAKDKAAMLTEAIGQKIGGALYIQENQNQQFSNIANYRGNVITGYSEDKFKSAPIEFEDIILKYSILVRFEILK